MGLQEIVRLSREYGSKPEYVKAGGGNTSYKTEDTLYVKASGFSLADIDEKGFAVLDRKKLDAIWDKSYPEDSAKREEVALADLMAARVEGETKRPSVEALLHALLPQTYIVHTHPPLANGLTCSRGGKSAAEELFGNSMVWIPSVNPGYILAKTIRDELVAAREKRGDEPAIILMQNHGIFVMSDEPEEIDRIYNDVNRVLKNNIGRVPDFSPVDVENRRKEAVEEELGRALGDGAGSLLFEANRELLSVLTSREAFSPLSSVYTPDHIVYCGPQPLYLQEKAVSESIADYKEQFARTPRIIACENLGVFAAGETEKIASTAMAMFLDATEIAVFSESFGGPSFLPDEQIQFILNWEVEHYRSKVSLEGSEDPA